MKNEYARHDIRWRASQAPTEANGPIDLKTIRRLLAGHPGDGKRKARGYARKTMGRLERAEAEFLRRAEAQDKLT